ncbi:MAG: MerR family DNA-binding transcriptional regulator, partial [Peptostreptococcaceae bacterium]
MLTIKEASEFLGVSVPTMRRWEKEGRITSYRTNG